MRLNAAQDYTLKQLKALGAKDIVITAHSGESFQNKFANNEVVANKNWDTSSISVFLSLSEDGALKTGGTDISYSDKTEIDRQLSRLVKFTKTNPINKNFLGLPSETFRYRDVRGIYDSDIKNLGTKSISILRDAIDLANQRGAERTGGTLSHDYGTTRLLTSTGVDESYNYSNISLSLRALTSDSSAHKVCVATNMKEFKYRPKIIQASEEAKLASYPERIKSGKYDIIFQPMAFANLVNEVGRATIAEGVETGSSFYLNKLNKQVSSEKFSLFDVGNLARGIGSKPFDIEGRPTKATELISSGTLKTYLNNSSSAKRFNILPTANAGLLYAKPSNLVVPIGRKSDDKLLSGLDDGLIVTNSWYHRYQNYIKGSFSVLPRDAIFVVKGGKIIGSAKDIRISGDMISLMKNVEELSNKKERIVNWESDIPAEVPSGRINNISVTSA